MYFVFNKQFFAPPAEIRESEDGYHISMELPGSLRDDIKVWAEQGVLTITGEKKAPSGDSKNQGGRLVSERVFGKFSRRFQLPEDVDTSMIKANLNDGVLIIEIAKSEKSKAKDIKIN